MIFQTAGSQDIAEVVFRSVKSGITATDTNANLQDGEPAVLTTATAGGPIGQCVIRPTTVTSVLNRLVIGVVRNTISHEAVGLVQVYGVGSVRLAEAATVAAGDKVLPDLNSTATALTSFGRGAWIARTITDADLHFSPAASIVIVAPATAVSGTTGTSATNAFIRAL